MYKSALTVEGKIKYFGYFDDKGKAYDAVYNNFVKIYGFTPWDKEGAV